MKSAKNPNRYFVQIHLVGHATLKTDGGCVATYASAQRFATRLRKEWGKYAGPVTIEDMGE
jgi:hypothetical protein